MSLRSVTEVVLMGTSCGLLGAIVVPRGFTFAGESLSHALLLGAAVALVAGGPVLGGALAGAVVAALAMGVLARRPEVGEDVAVGVVFTGFLAASVMLLSAHNRTEDLEGLLFGNLGSVSLGDLALGLGVTALLVVGFAAFAGRLVAVGFDRDFAQSIGLRPALGDTLLLVALAAGLTVALTAVGTLLVLSLLVAPAATARVLARRVRTTFWLAPLLGACLGVAGLAIADYGSLEAGPVIALTGVTAFAVAAVAGRRRVATA